MANNQISRQNRQDLQVSGNGENSKELTILEFSVIWGRLTAAYPKSETTALTIEVYFERLAAYEKDAVIEAIGECLEQCKWFPAISEIVERIRSPRGCIHRLALAEIRSRETMLKQSEQHSERRLEAIAKEVAELERRDIELFRAERKMIEDSGLPIAQAELAKVKDQIIEQQRILTILRQKVKLMDQARILQGDDQPEH